jgi:hypothetical protein
LKHREAKKEIKTTPTTLANIIKLKNNKIRSRKEANKGRATTGGKEREKKKKNKT